MSADVPDLIAINHDEYAAKYIGLTKDGRQFFLTTPFVPAVAGAESREFLALYLFDGEGRFLEAIIHDFGSRQNAGYPPGNTVPLGTENEDPRSAKRDELLRRIGPVTFDRIEIEPFQIERFGIAFGLIPREPDGDDEDHIVAVEAQPGNYMAFFEPWDSGEYDT